MAVAGLTQGAAAGVWLGSWLVLAYVAAGMVVWNWGVRPLEERDLERRFGPAFDAYRAEVKCWFPRLRPYG
jgi:protein-S-isoprenylcysteine O-methyltransferase Ste14